MGIELVSGIDGMAILAVTLSAVISYLFQEFLIPRGLSGLQVAFPTGPKRYEYTRLLQPKKKQRNSSKPRACVMA